ncbi:hypothetical protein RvY_17127 [Ramazzottius varieornatus]|uniref:Uncharacterized protein n=1 Tax=Ramazzottius varieornatus TaxID=947166 RepID=A0A1D1W518_RAMVA|nr:hypothetical protein RvY_17127 [Ramazzottius varieornatus]
MNYARFNSYGYDYAGAPIPIIILPVYIILPPVSGLAPTAPPTTTTTSPSTTTAPDVPLPDF